MKITGQHVEAMLQKLFELGEQVEMTRLPAPGIIMPGVRYEERFRVSLRGPEPNTTYYEGTQRQCSCYIAELTMRLALEHVFGNEKPTLAIVPDEPRDSLPQTDEDPSAA